MKQKEYSVGKILSWKKLRAMKYILIIILLASCARPFCVGKKHQLVWGAPATKSKRIVEITKTIVLNDSMFCVVFTDLGNNKEYRIDSLTQREFNKKFKPFQ